MTYLTAQIDKVLELVGRFVAPVDNIGHIRGQHKRRSIPFKIAKHLRIAKEFAKINVEKMASRFDHNIVIMTITDP